MADASAAIMAAAGKMITQMFDIAAKRMAEETRSRIPDGSPVQDMTDAMIAQLQAQVTRALGVTPQEGKAEDAAATKHRKSRP